MGANSAGLTALMDGGAQAPLYVAIGDGPTSADQVSNERVEVVWGGAALGLLTATGVPYAFTGTPSAAATHMLLFSASTAGTFYGFEALSGDQAFSAAGEFDISELTLAAIPFDPETPLVPTEPFSVGDEVGVPTGTTLTDRSTLGSPTSTDETYEIINPVTAEAIDLDMDEVYRGIRFTQTVTPAAGAGNRILFQDCSFEGLGFWSVEINSAGHDSDIMSPMVIFDHCSFDGGGEGDTSKCLLGGAAWVVDCDMRGAEDGWAGWFYNVAIRTNFLGFGATIDLHSDGVQCTDTGRSIFSQCYFQTTGPGASQSFRVGTEAGAAQDIDVRYSALDGGGYAMQFRGDSGAGDITNVAVVGCRWTRNHEFGPIDVEETTGVTWSDNAYFDGEVIPSPV